MVNEKRGTPAWLIALIVVAALVPVLGIVAALGIYGVRSYVLQGKAAEGRATVTALAKGIAKCASSSKALPPTSAAVPRDLASVSGKKYASSAADWADPTLSCAGFSVRAPQYFQYQWLRIGADQGEAQARADFNGDGVPELKLVTAVDCRTGTCAIGPLVELGELAASGSSQRAASSSSAGAPDSSASRADRGPPILAMILAGAYVIASLVGAIWATVITFQVSVSWGLLSLFVPCAHFVFLVKFWDRAKKPFLIQVAALPLLFASVILIMISEASAQHAAPVASPNDTARVQPTVSEDPPPPPQVSGTPVDLSTVMGRARALADAWQPEAALCGIDATIRQGLIQTGEGDQARLVFGPSPFRKLGERTGSFVVTYDAAGIHGAPSSEGAGKALVEPMCAPETAYARATASSGARVRLRYALDSHGKSALWLLDGTTDGAQPKTAFDGQRCAPAAR